MLAKMHYIGPWQQAHHVSRALCEDGRRRYARITGEPDTFFSIPASVQVKGKTVSGFITGCKTEGERDYEFIAYAYGKNAGLLKKEK